MQGLDPMHFLSSNLRPKERGLWEEAFSRGFAARMLFPPPGTKAQDGQKLSQSEARCIWLSQDWPNFYFPSLPPQFLISSTWHKSFFHPPLGSCPVACLRVEGLAQQTASSVVHPRVQPLGGHLRHWQATLRRGFERIAAWHWSCSGALQGDKYKNQLDLLSRFWWCYRLWTTVWSLCIHIKWVHSLFFIFYS